MSDSTLKNITTLVLKNSDKSQLEAAQNAIGLKASKTLSIDKAVEGKSDIQTSQDGAMRLESLGIEADICVMPTQDRRKKLLICDMDSTLIGQECIDELADFAGVKARVSAITERAMRGEIGFEGALRERVGLLEDLPLSTLQKCFDERIHLNAGARTLCQTMKAHGAKTVIVSGGFTFFSGRVAKACGFDHHQANILLENGDTLSGKVADPILGREAKLEAMRSHIADTSQAIAIGDGANDLAMITAAGLGLAFYAKPAVAEAAHSAIRFTDLTSALYYQGFSDEDFVN